MKNKKDNYSNVYNFANRNKKIIAGIISGIMALVMVMGVVASALL